MKKGRQILRSKNVEDQQNGAHSADTGKSACIKFPLYSQSQTPEPSKSVFTRFLIL